MTDVQDKIDSQAQIDEMLQRFADGFSYLRRSPILHTPAEHLEFEDVSFSRPRRGAARGVVHPRRHRRRATDPRPTGRLIRPVRGVLMRLQRRRHRPRQASSRLSPRARPQHQEGTNQQEAT
jgi:hypothetical protein